ncbi:hypothetical protein [Streptomyces sp. WAC 01529]|uniref:hypothetical protein n=1 Tax=Streptomyces sp. WAC 01529 TaxID=2203205 RepID=UPI0019D06598|nr:hypothetical protein [Streptomyces sp. WAC 01529]
MTDENDLEQIATGQQFVGARIVQPNDPVRPRLFVLRRHVDVSGVSGTGVIADGAEWPDGTASLRWRGEHPKIDFADRGVTTLHFVHGHSGATEVEYLEDEPADAPVLDAPVALRRVIDIALGKPVRCPQCGRPGACRCIANRHDARVDVVLEGVLAYLARTDGAA